MKGKMIAIIILLLFTAFVLLGLNRYYFYSSFNVHYIEAMNSRIEFYFDEKMTVLNRRVEKSQIKDDLYQFDYIATLTDGDITFTMIDVMYDDKRIGGHLFGGDYWNFRDDYVRQKIKNIDYDFSEYEINFYDAVVNNQPDYVFILNGENVDEIAEKVTKILEVGMKDYTLDLWFEIQNENGERITDSYKLVKACKEEKIRNDDLNDYIISYLR